MSKFIFSLLLSAFAVSSVEACVYGKTFIPKGAEVIDPNPDKPITNGMTEEKFGKIADDIAALYRSKVEAKGRKLVVVKEWKNTTPNAYVTTCPGMNCEGGVASGSWGRTIDNTKEKTFEVHMFGGLAKKDGSTDDAYALVMCHELGHVLGGAPFVKRQDEKNRWASNEGQADYFATTKCLRKYFGTQDNAAIIATQMVPPTLQDACFEAWGPSKEHALCVRMSMAGLAITTVFFDMDKISSYWGMKKKPSFDTKDKKEVKVTNDAHPAPQCRLDTYFSGAQCSVSEDEDFGKDEFKSGACDQGTKAGRPSCWFAAN